MDRHRNPRVEATGKVLAFPPRGLRRGATPSEVERVRAEHLLVQRQQRAAAWLDGAWVFLAWTVAVFRLRLAITHREVFDLEASLAFLVVVLMPVLRAESIATSARGALATLRRLTSRGGTSESRGHAPSVPPGHSLQ